MPIEHHGDGATITGDSIDFLRLAALRGAVKIECAGMRVRRGPVIWRQVAKEFGIKGNKHAVLAWLEAKIAEQRPLQEHVDESGRRTVGGQTVQ